MTTPTPTTTNEVPRPKWAEKLRHYQWAGAQWLAKPPFPMRGRLLNDDRGFG